MKPLYRLPVPLLVFSILNPVGTSTLWSQSADDIRANEKALGFLRSHILYIYPPGSLSWSVARKLVQVETSRSGWPDQKRVISGSQFMDPQKRSKWYRDTEQQLNAALDNVTIGIDANSSTLPALADDYEDVSFQRLKMALDKNAPIRFAANLRNVQSSTVALRLTATAALIKSASTPSDIALEKEACRGLLQILDDPKLDDASALIDAKKQAKLLLGQFNDNAQTILSTLQADRGHLRQLAYIGLGLSDQAPLRVQSVGGTIADAVNMARSFGEFTTAQDDFVKNVQKQSRDVSESLARDLSNAEREWPILLNDANGANQIPGGPIPEEVNRVASFAQGVSQLRTVLNGGVQGLRDPSAVALLNLGISQTSLVSPELAKGLSALTSAKDNYANAALGLASAIGIKPPPELRSVMPLLSTAASFMSGAGPLVAIAGLGGGGGVLSLMSGFGGGGPDYSQDFAKIERELAEINVRLSNIENKLDKLQEQIANNQRELMSALEAISFDVARTHSLLISEYQLQTREHCLVAKNSKQGDPMAAVTKCDETLTALLKAEETPTLFTLESNLSTKDLQDNAQKALRRETKARSTLSKFARGHNCNGLFYPSSTINDLERKQSYSPAGTLTCDQITTKKKLLEPGIVAQYVRDDLDAMTSSYQSRTSSDWWSKHSGGVRERRMLELGLLNYAIAQQSFMVGDVVLPDIVRMIDSHGDLSPLKTFWGEEVGSILAENAMRFWLWNRIHNDASARVLYGISWYGDDARFWYSMTGTRPEEITFVQEPAERVLPDGTSKEEKRWIVMVPGLNTKVALPNPKEWMNFELRWTNALIDLHDTRKQLLDELAGTDVLSKLAHRNAADETLEIFALAMQ